MVEKIKHWIECKKTICKHNENGYCNFSESDSDTVWINTLGQCMEFKI